LNKKRKKINKNPKLMNEIEKKKLRCTSLGGQTRMNVFLVDDMSSALAFLKTI